MTSTEEPCQSRSFNRIVHVHIPKTAGSAFTEAFRNAYGEALRVYPERFESRYGEVRYSEFDFFTGHIGFKLASEIGGDLITVLRDPVDRFLSTYYFLRQLYRDGLELSHKASLATRYDIDQFVQIRDEPILQQEHQNRMTWQVAYSHRLELRNDLVKIGVGDSELVRIALSNLRKFAIVGIQTDMPGLARAIQQRYHVRLSIGRVNVTRLRRVVTEIPSRTLARLDWWLHLDQQLYQTWIKTAK